MESLVDEGLANRCDVPCKKATMMELVKRANENLLKAACC